MPERPASPITRPSVIFTGCLLVFLSTTAILIRGEWPTLLYRLLTDGVLCLLWLTAMLGWGFAARRLMRLGDIRSLFDAIVAFALGIGICSILILVLGLAGWFRGVSAWATIVIGVAFAAKWLIGSIVGSRRGKRTISVSRQSWLWLLAMPALAISLCAALVPPGILWGDEPNGYDVVEYHLQVPREWFEARRITPLAHNVYSYFPFNVEMHYLLAMNLRAGPWAGMYLAQFMHVALFILTVLAIYAAMKDRGGEIAAIAAAGAPWLILLALVAYDEGGLLLFGTLAIALAMRAKGDPKQLLLAGAMTGFACGVKLTAAPMLGIGIPIALIFSTLLARARIPTRGLAMFVAAAAITFAPWLIRNAVWARNPVFPEATEIFGRGKFSDMQQQRWQLAHSAKPEQASLIGRLKEAKDQILLDDRFGLLAITGIAALCLCVLRREFLPPVLFLVFATIWLGFTHLQGRFFVLAIPVFAIALGEVSSIDRKHRAVVTAIVAIAVVVGLTQWALHYGAKFQTLVDSQVLGVEKLDGLNSVSRAGLDVPDDATLVLVGDAGAFWYSRPMSRLRYRTVFDVPATASDELVHTWVGPLNAGDVIVVDPNELRRFSNPGTGYYQIPPPPPAIAQHDEPFIAAW